MISPLLSLHAGQFEHDGHRDTADKEENGVVFGQVEHTAQGSDRFFFNVVSPI